jgi:hypothetical protein
MFSLMIIMQEKLCQDIPQVKENLITTLIIETLSEQTDWPLAVTD